MTMKVKVISKYRITIPKEIRKCLGVQVGDNIIFIKDKNGIKMQKLRKK